MSEQLEPGYDTVGVDINSKLDVAIQAMNDSSLLIETFNDEIFTLLQTCLKILCL